MVVREQKVDSADQASMHTQRTSTSMSSAGRSDEEGYSSSSSSSDPYNTPLSAHRKRKADDADDDKEVKRRKNREAAKRCRDKKQQQTEDLKRKNGELEKENCDLAKQRDELIRKCKEYQREIEQHKQQGCVVPHFTPPYDLNHLLQPSSPTSPSLSESAPSTSSCPSPTPSVSPGPPPKYLSSARNEFSSEQLLQEGLSGGANSPARDVTRGARSITVTTMPASSCLGELQPNPDTKRRHYLKVRNKDGTHKYLCLDHENYLKVMHRLKVQRAAAAKTAQRESTQTATSAPLITDNTQLQQVQLPHEQPEAQRSPNTSMMHACGIPVKEEQEESPKPGQKLDTCDDLLSILRTHVKDSGNGFELTPVSEDEVPIKQEPLDAEYEQNNIPVLDRHTGSARVIQDDMMVPESSGTWTSTGQQIRTSLDTLTNPDDLPSTNALIQNIVQYLKRDEFMGSTFIGASTVQQPAQTMGKKLITRFSSAKPPETASYVTSSASVGALNKTNAGSGDASLLQDNSRWQVSNQTADQPQTGSQEGRQQSFVIPTVKLRPHAAGLVNSASVAPGEKEQDIPVVASSTLTAHIAGQEASRVNAVHSSVTSSGSMTSETGLTLMSTMSPSAGSVLTIPTTGDMRMQMTIGQLSTTTSHTGFPQESPLYIQLPTSSTVDTSAIAPLHLQGVTSAHNLLSASTSQIAEYLKTNSIETMDV